MSAEKQGAQHVSSRLMRESLMDRRLIASTDSPVRPILPNLNVIQIGGVSIVGRGPKALLPVLDQIVSNQESQAQGTGRAPGGRGRPNPSGGLCLAPPARP